MNTHRVSVSRDPLGTTTTSLETRAEELRNTIASLYNSAPWRPFSLCFPMDQDSEVHHVFEAAPRVPNPMAHTWSAPLPSGVTSSRCDFVFNPFGCDDDIHTSPSTVYTSEGFHTLASPVVAPSILAQEVPFTFYTADGIHSEALSTFEPSNLERESPSTQITEFRFDPFGDSSPAVSPRILYDSTQPLATVVPQFDAPALQLRFSGTPGSTPPLSYEPESGVDSPSTSPDSSLIVVDTGDTRTYTEMKVMAPKPRALMRPVAQLFEIQAWAESLPSLMSPLKDLTSFPETDQYTASEVFAKAQVDASTAEVEDGTRPSAQLVADMKLLLSMPVGPQKDEISRRLFGWNGPSSFFGQQYLAPTFEAETSGDGA
ncbi:hypothetical protein DXG03_008730 [Asterophora parasitica]|uniref:Uncharacterized protein n=1 Tax=Asterophora parasitica TaxID=117018 RepID=A0A9P7G587_9AGAR|nr:hypothetical protein DXG03_008730 [Asterophora parasitica]